MTNSQEMNDVAKQVLTTLAYCDNSIIEKIPTKFLKYLNKLAADSKASFYIEPEKSLTEQDITEESRDLISLIYYSFVADENEKTEIANAWKHNEEVFQKELMEKYNSNNIFKNNSKKPTENIDVAQVSMIENKETIITKIINKIKSKIMQLNKKRRTTIQIKNGKE